MRVALLIGIDHYNSATALPLSGCGTDARQLKAALQHHWDGGVPNFQCRLIVSDPTETSITPARIQAEMTQALMSEADVVWIHFSGHGGVEGGGDTTEGVIVAENGHSLRMSTILQLIRRSPAKQKILTLDCCSAGRAGFDDELGAGMSVVPDRCAILAASRSGEAAEEDAHGGRFTTILTEGLNGGAADVTGSVTIAGLYGFLDEAFAYHDQRPVLKASQTRLVRLRECKPDVDRKVLRKLPTWFPEPSDVYPLNRTYEPTEGSYQPDRGAIFSDLQQCARARLVEPVEAEHLYYAAINETGCRLTNKGRRYWRLAKQQRL